MRRRAGETFQDDGASDSSPGSLAAGLDDTLDSPSIQERRGIPAGDLQRVHLTAQVSKAMERFLGSLVVTFVSLPVNAGPNQFAYQRARGARDALAYMVLTWLDGFNKIFKFAMYCLDVSGAFDRVNTQRMLDKLRAKGMRDDMVKVFEAWLAERKALVVCGGQQGNPIQLDSQTT